MRSNRARAATTSLLGLLAALLALTPAAAYAATSPAASVDPGWQLVWQTPVPAEGIFPGDERRGRISLRNDRAEPIDMALSLTDVSDDERGCLPAERLSPREDCGPDGARGTGELSSQLSLRMTVVGGDPVLEGVLAELEGVRAARLEVPAGERRDLEVLLHLPVGSTNETMTDAAGFGLRADVRGTGFAASSAVLGASAQADAAPAERPPSGAGPLGGLLPDTGSAVSRGLVAGALLLLALGIGLVRTASGPRRA